MGERVYNFYPKRNTNKSERPFTLSYHESAAPGSASNEENGYKKRFILK
jgi:hypothetical protein